MKKSRGVLSEKERLSLLVKKIAKQCKSLNELADKLKQKKLKPYYRKGIFNGLWFKNRKFRLTTLGIDKSKLKVLTKEQERLNSLSSKAKKHNKNRER